MTEKDWFERFTQHRNALFTKEDFDNYKKAILKDIKYYEKYLPKGSKILELGCGEAEHRRVQEVAESLL